MSGLWSVRDARAELLIETQPHAAELLSFYRHILRHQETVYTEAKGAHSLHRLLNASSTPRLGLVSLPTDQLAGLFEEFIEAVRYDAPEVTAEIGGSLLNVSAATVLRWFVATSEEVMSDCQNYSQVQLEFYPRAFLQPLIQGMTDTLDLAEIPTNGTSCPVCGALPQLSVLEDEPETRGQRRLLCSLCSTAWRFSRVTCPNCRESSSDKLFRHENDSVPYVSIDECSTCRRYLKSIDLRKNGRAAPLVDDIATVELDLWAGERKLTKIQPNLLGF